MRLVHDNQGRLEIRWTWLPFWLAVNPKMKDLVEKDLRDSCLMNGVTNSQADLDALHDFVARRLQELFPGFSGLADYLDGLKYIHEVVVPEAEPSAH